MARWKEAARYAVVDLSDPGRAQFMAPGFYWFIPLDGDQVPEGMDEDHTIHLVGPFPTHDEARDDAVAWMHGVLTLSPTANDNTFKDAA